MWLEPLSQLCVALALVGQPAAAPPAAGPQVVTTQQAFFAIPFRLDPVADPARQPTEMQLMVSTDQGAHWQLYGRANRRSSVSCSAPVPMANIGLPSAWSIIRAKCARRPLPRRDCACWSIRNPRNRR